MDTLMQLANKHGIYVVEDAAQSIDSFYKGKALGTIVLTKGCQVLLDLTRGCGY